MTDVDNPQAILARLKDLDPETITELVLEVAEDTEDAKQKSVVHYTFRDKIK